MISGLSRVLESAQPFLAQSRRRIDERHPARVFMARHGQVDVQVRWGQGGPRPLRPFDEQQRSGLPLVPHRQALEPFTALQRDIAQRVHPASTAAGSTGVDAGVDAGDAAGSRPVTPDFGPLVDQAARIAGLVNAQIDADLGSLRDQTDSARRELFWESGLLLPLALAATLSFAFGIGRPIRQVDRAITELGGGDFAREIAVSGPIDLQRLGQQLEWLRGRLLELAQERNRFLRHMSHELKTPLAVIQANAEALGGTLSVARQAEARAGLRAGLERAVHAIHQLLALGRSSADLTAAPRLAVRLEEFVRERLAFHGTRALALGIELEFELRAPGRVVLEPDSAGAMLDNLFDNALKYSPPGGHVLVIQERRDDGLWLVVQDQGPGIPAAFRAQVFQRFFRLPGSEQVGSGLGLAIVERAARRHGVTVRLDDGPGGCGLAVHLHFPDPADEQRKPR